MLIIDVSPSMQATDVSPSRLSAAEEAGKQFADELTPGINLGLIAFGGSALALVSPTTNREGTNNAMDKLQIIERTAIGEAAITPAGPRAISSTSSPCIDLTGYRHSRSTRISVIA